MNRMVALVIVLMMPLTLSCAKKIKVGPEGARVIAKNAYIYGYPMLENYKLMYAYAIYQDEADDERYRAWVHERTAAVAARGGAGVYLGDTDFTRRQDRFLSDANFERLRAIRERWDPAGRFASYLTADPGRLNVHG